MKPDDPPPGPSGSPEAPPPASLSNVRLRNRGQGEAPVKRGDITQQLASEAPPPAPAEPSRGAPKRGDLTQHLAEAAARRAPPTAAQPAPSSTEPPAERKPQAKVELPLERKAVTPKAESVPEPKAVAPKAESVPEPKVELSLRKAAAPKAEPAPEPKVELSIRKALAAKAEPAPTPTPKVELSLRRGVAPKAEPASDPVVEPPPERKAAIEPLHEAEPALFERKPAVARAPEPEPAAEREDAGKIEPPPSKPTPVEANLEPEATAPMQPLFEDKHAHISAGAALDEDDIRALLDPPGRRPARTEPPAAEVIAVTTPSEEPALAPEAAAAPAANNDTRLTQDEIDAIMAGGDAPPAQDPVPAPAKAESADLHLVAEPPKKAEKPAPAPAPAAAATGRTPANSIDQIIDYWDSLRGDRPFPSVDALDRSHISRSWPNCLLVAFTGAEGATSRLTRLGEANGQVEFSAMVIDWIMSRGRQSVRRGEPMEEEKRFNITGGHARYQLLLLPLSSTESKSDHVLCHLCRIQELSAGAAFKRWLAS